jgi:hypothetical protein
VEGGPAADIAADDNRRKSWAATDFVAWVAGKNLDLKTIFERVGEIGWMCNTNLIEYAGRAGSFRNTTINGAINGMELHLGVIDDPLKGRAEAFLAPCSGVPSKAWPGNDVPAYAAFVLQMLSDWAGPRSNRTMHLDHGQLWFFLHTA